MSYRTGWDGALAAETFGWEMSWMSRPYSKPEVSSGWIKLYDQLRVCSAGYSILPDVTPTRPPRSPRTVLTHESLSVIFLLDALRFPMTPL